jgi:hypothetical protein
MSRAPGMEMHYAITNEAIIPPVVKHDPSQEATYVAHASLRPREPRSLSREELSQYPELPEELQELLVSPDPDAPVLDNPLALLVELAPVWAEDGMSQQDIVKEIQKYCNVMFDARNIRAANGMAGEAVVRAHGGTIFVPESKEVATIGAQLRDDVPSVIEFMDSAGNSRYELMTPRSRKQYGITALKVLERDFELAEPDIGRSNFPSRIQMHAESDENKVIKGEYDD